MPGMRGEFEMRLATIGFACLLVYLGMAPGDPGENRYGEQPQRGINLGFRPEESNSI
jgi:uncharacterized membrane protein YhaH (DUF805 family)